MRSLDRDLRVSIPLRLLHRVYLPDGYPGAPDAAPWPLILFLHGAGQRGEELSLAVTEGLPAKLEGGDELPFVVVVPQCPRNLDWSTVLPPSTRSWPTSTRPCGSIPIASTSPA